MKWYALIAVVTLLVAVNVQGQEVVSVRTTYLSSQSDNSTEKLWVPVVEVNVNNSTGKPLTNLKLEVEFAYESENTGKEVFTTGTEYAISSYDRPLRAGYSQRFQVRGEMGFRDSGSWLFCPPNIDANIYVNGTYIGSAWVQGGERGVFIDKKLRIEKGN